MRVLSVINSLGASGGAEHALVREITRFDSKIDHLVVRLFEKDQLESLLRAAGVEVVALGFNSSQAGYNWPVVTRKLSRLIGAFQPDVVQSSLFAANLVAQLSSRRSGTPVMSTFTLSGDRRLLRTYQPGAATLRAEMLRRVARYAASVRHVTFRGLTRETVETNCRLLRLDPSRAVVIPRGVPEQPAPSTQDRSVLSLPDHVPVILNVGRQSAQKGQEHLLGALQLVLKQRRAHLAIVGREGDSTPVIKELISASNLAANVTLVGYSPDVPEYLRYAAVLAFPSFMEGMPNVVLEAMAAGVPVVAFDIPPVREVTDGGRFAALVEPGDTAGLAEAIMRALDRDRKVLARAQAARAWVRSHYSIEAVARQVESRLRELARLG